MSKVETIASLANFIAHYYEKPFREQVQSQPSVLATEPIQQTQATPRETFLEHLRSYFPRKGETQKEKSITPIISSTHTPTFQAAVNKFVERVADFTEGFSLNIPEWEIRRAGMIGIVYGNVSLETMKTFQEKFMSLTRHDDVPVDPSDTFNYNLASDEVMKLWDECFDKYSGAFTDFAYATRRTQSDGFSMFERFIRQVNNEKNYTSHGVPYGFKIEDFPGPGFVIDGINSRVFRDNALQEEFGAPFEKYDSSYLRAEKEFRNILIGAEESLKLTTYALFRSIIIIRNPKIIVDGKRYALVIFNAHSHNPTQEMVYLILDKFAKEFISNPTRNMNKKNNFYPDDYGERYRDNVLNLTWQSIIGGGDKALPVDGVYYIGSIFYDRVGKVVRRDLNEHERIYETRETYEILPKRRRGHTHRTHMFGQYWDNMDRGNLIPFKLAHDEVIRSSFLGLALFDLLKEAFRLYEFGYDFDQKKTQWRKDDYRLLKESLDIRESKRIKEKPLLVPTERLACAKINPHLLRKVGFIDTSEMRYYRTNPHGDLDLPQRLPRYAFNTREPWEVAGGVEETKNWLDIEERAHHSGSNLVFIHPQLKQELLDIMREG